MRILDVRGETCPDPLTLTLAEMKSMGAGEHLTVILDSPLALETISRWVERAGHRLLGVSEVGPAEWQIMIEKAGA